MCVRALTPYGQFGDLLGGTDSLHQVKRGGHVPT